MRVYVATPYQFPKTHRESLLKTLLPEDEAAYVDYRARAAAVITAHLQLKDFNRNQSTWFYTPIAYEHGVILGELDSHYSSRLRLNHNYWLSIDLKILESMQGLLIVALPGWSLSTGITKELAFMRNMLGARTHIYVPRAAVLAATGPGYAGDVINTRLQALDASADTSAYNDISVSTELGKAVAYFA